MEAVILAGGLGMRLRTILPDLPKPMAPIKGRPFLELLLASLGRKGVRRAVVSLGYRADVVIAHFGARFGQVDLHYEVEDTPLGTGGAIRRALAACDSATVLIVNGDTFLDLDIDALRHHWSARHTPAIVARPVADTARYGRLVVEPDGRVSGFAEKGAAGAGLINTGHYFWPRGLLDGQGLPQTFSIESDFLVAAVRTQRFDALPTEGRFIDIGVPEDYARAQIELADLVT